MTTERDRIQARADADAQSLKTVRMDLDAFLALKGEDRAARWQQLDRASKQDLVIQQLGRCGYDWTDELVAEQIARYDAKLEVTDLVIPPAAEIAALAKERRDLGAAQARISLDVALANWQYFFEQGRGAEARSWWAVAHRLMIGK